MVEIKNASDRTQQTKAEVMATTSSVPQSFYVVPASRSKSLVLHLAGTTPKGKVYPGSLVSNSKKPGAFGLTVALPPKDIDSKDQVLLNTIHRNNGLSSRSLFTFSKMHEDLTTQRPMQMVLHVSELKDSNNIDSSSESSTNSVPIPLLVGPSSIRVAEDFTAEELETLGYDPDINWGNLAKNVISALPVIADAGFKIYQQVSGNKSSSETGEAEPDIWGALIGAVANVAVPLISKLL